jgi:hypothetical protein
MPVRLILNAADRITITVLEGFVTDAELIATRRQVLSDPAFDPAYDRIWDFHAATDSFVSEPVALQMVSESPLPGQPICRAVVMSQALRPQPAILDFIDRNRRARRRIAAFPDRHCAVEWIKFARTDLPPEVH